MAEKTFLQKASESLVRAIGPENINTVLIIVWVLFVSLLMIILSLEANTCIAKRRPANKNYDRLKDVPVIEEL